VTEILINELSLSGQFASVDEFITGGALLAFVALLKEINNTDVLLYKKYDFFGSKITKDRSIHNVLVGDMSRQFDEIRKFKTGLACLFENPYWEDDQKHNVNYAYRYKGDCVSGQSLAEACERDKIVISFMHPDFPSGNLAVIREETEIVLDNLINEKNYFEIARNRNIISFEDYCTRRFTGGKLDFSKVSKKEGFSLIPREEENLFLDGFRKFVNLSWTEIGKDKGFFYKEYNDRKGHFKSFNRKIHKFRISKKYRCFGYEEREIFHVLLFDLTHDLSDEG
jgi:hypothetical protein